MSADGLLIRVYGDLLGMPRSTDGISYMETYAEILADGRSIYPRRQVHLYNRSRGAGTVRSLIADYLQDTSYFGTGETDILVIQCGICDCAPLSGAARCSHIYWKAARTAPWARNSGAAQP